MWTHYCNEEHCNLEVEDDQPCNWCDEVQPEKPEEELECAG